MITVDGFLDEARGFLDAHLERRAVSDEKFVWGEGSDRVNILEETEASALTTTLAEAKRYAALRFDAGLGWIEGPVEHGGRGLSAEHARAYHQLEATYDVPDLSILTIAVGFVGPALLACATPELCVEYLPKLYRGDLIMCQLFSEPNAGSDLASASTRAVRDGDEWVISGRRCGRRARTSPTWRSRCAAPIPTCRSTRDSPRSSSTCTRRESRCDHCGR